MDWKLEVVPIPVSDVDLAKAFYSEQVGVLVDLDTDIGDGMRLVQMTLPGLGCSIWVEGRGGEWNSFVFFSDPDGNEWVVQERPARDRFPD